jgi:hypothetical protein
MTPEDKASIYIRQLIDCNCNDCIFLSRNNEKNNKRREERKITGKGDNYLYGSCGKNGKEIFFSPNTCQIDTQDCFEHRNKHKEEEILKYLEEL